jgi:hypothetical protein
LDCFVKDGIFFNVVVFFLARWLEGNGVKLCMYVCSLLIIDFSEYVLCLSFKSQWLSQTIYVLVMRECPSLGNANLIVSC